MTPRNFRRHLAVAVAVAMMTAVSTPTTLGGSDVAFTGRVLRADGVTPQSGVTVNLVEAEGQQSFSSRPTDDHGAFRIDEASAGNYRLIVETEDGAFLAPERVELEPGTTRSMALSLHNGSPNYEQDQGLGKQGSKMPAFGKWIITGFIIAISAYTIYQINEDDDKDVSPFGSSLGSS